MVNKVILIGNVGADPDVKYLEGGVAVARFSLATSEVYNNKNTDGRLQVSWSGFGKAEDADIFVIAVEHKLSDGSYESTSVVAMPDYMIDKTVLNISKNKTDDKPENNNDTYTFDICLLYTSDAADEL